MKQLDIEIFNEIIETHPQFKKTSRLYDEIVKTLGCSLAHAKELAATHCNMISFYAILTANETYFGHYSEYFRWMLSHNFCNDKGYIFAEKKDIISELGIKASLEKFREIEDVVNPVRLNADKFYQIKIKGNTSGFHFMGGYIEDGIFRLSDTSYRGIGVKGSAFITPENFNWIMEI